VRVVRCRCVPQLATATVFMSSRPDLRRAVRPRDRHVLVRLVPLRRCRAVAWFGGYRYVEALRARTAKALGLDVSLQLQQRADEVIE
jgi:hypothetical protein